MNKIQNIKSLPPSSIRNIIDTPIYKPEIKQTQSFKPLENIDQVISFTPIERNNDEIISPKNIRKIEKDFHISRLNTPYTNSSREDDSNLKIPDEITHPLCKKMQEYLSEHNLSLPDKIPKSHIYEFESLLPIFGECTLLALFSKDYKLRLAGLYIIKNNWRLIPKKFKQDYLFQSIAYLTDHLLKDDIKSVYETTLNMVYDILSNDIDRIDMQRISRNTITKGIDFIYDRIFKRLSDKNHEIVDSSVSIILNLSTISCVGYDYSIKRIVSITKKKVASSIFYKPMVKRLEILTQIIFQTNYLSDNSIEMIKSFILDCLTHKSNFVRDAAVDCLGYLLYKYGPSELLFIYRSKFHKNFVQSIVRDAKILAEKLENTYGIIIRSENSSPIHNSSPIRKSSPKKSTPINEINLPNVPDDININSLFIHTNETFIPPRPMPLEKPEPICDYGVLTNIIYPVQNEEHVKSDEFCEDCDNNYKGKLYDDPLFEKVEIKEKKEKKEEKKEMKKEDEKEVKKEVAKEEVKEVVEDKAVEEKNNDEEKEEKKKKYVRRKVEFDNYDDCYDDDDEKKRGCTLL